MTVLLFAIQLALSIAVPWGIVRFDLSRLSGERLDRSWNRVTFLMSVVVFGPLCIPFHFIKTRRSLWGVLLGAFWMIAALAVIAIVGAGLESVL
ncbi:MAG: hypothetical protein KC776_26225 [Myxococcales bacterium]|nr:hypothetical protein [Myxococcales bacterium]MCB9579103.1 hypothetical protein [Polyangiaceae bacterium]